MIPIVSIVGKSDSGKTFLIEQLICAERSRLVAVVADHGVSLDVPVYCREEIPRFVDWVEERFLRDQGSEVTGEDPASKA
jgi:hypothetical protein